MRRAYLVHVVLNMPRFTVLNEVLCTKSRVLHLILLTSKKWRLQSGCNHSTAYVDQWKG